MKPGALDTLTSPKGIGIFHVYPKLQNVMTEQVYLCASSHFHPIKDPHDPICLVWIAESGNHENVTSKVYLSLNFAEMLSLAHKLAHERGMTLTVLSTNIEPEVIYDKTYISHRDSCNCSSNVEQNGSDGCLKNNSENKISNAKRFCTFGLTKLAVDYQYETKLDFKVDTRKLSFSQMLQSL